MLQRFQERLSAAPAGPRGLALLRIGLGTFAWTAPRAMNRVFGVPRAHDSAALDYMNRVFGVRAVALGTGYVLADDPSRALWERLWLLCDAADTAMGAGMVARRRLGAVTGAQALLLTGGATAIDLMAVRRRRQRPATDET